MENFPLLCLLTGGHVKNNQTHETAMCCMVCRLIEILLAKKTKTWIRYFSGSQLLAGDLISPFVAMACCMHMNCGRRWFSWCGKHRQEIASRKGQRLLPLVQPHIIYCVKSDSKLLIAHKAGGASLYLYGRKCSSSTAKKVLVCLR